MFSGASSSATQQQLASTAGRESAADSDPRRHGTWPGSRLSRHPPATPTSATKSATGRAPGSARPLHRHEHVESRMRGDVHVRFGGRVAETHRPKDRQGAAARPLHPRGHLVRLCLCGVHHRRLQPLPGRLAGFPVAAHRPGPGRPGDGHLAPAGPAGWPGPSLR
jgi:hypothetical protein